MSWAASTSAAPQPPPRASRRDAGAGPPGHPSDLLPLQAPLVTPSWRSLQHACESPQSLTRSPSAAALSLSAAPSIFSFAARALAAVVARRTSVRKLSWPALSSVRLPATGAPLLFPLLPYKRVSISASASPGAPGRPSPSPGVRQRGTAAPPPPGVHSARSCAGAVRNVSHSVRPSAWPSSEALHRHRPTHELPGVQVSTRGRAASAGRPHKPRCAADPIRVRFVLALALPRGLCDAPLSRNSLRHA